MPQGTERRASRARGRMGKESRVDGLTAAAATASRHRARRTSAAGSADTSSSSTAAAASRSRFVPCYSSEGPSKSPSSRSPSSRFPSSKTAARASASSAGEHATVSGGGTSSYGSIVSA